ncbi:hypothetical protein WR25_27058 [Diploscapter pachys]|uniref:Thioredoxin-like fold domain-containing protein n=1 Tax=Diploscapter pachys TaxID=2018661 RepID=A0A2A2KCJ4_9BILA|nr:hypothetical protein WR25_27058 [Diploscapter pachys]
MSFEELYDSCFRNVSLIKVSKKDKEPDAPSSLLVTLNHVMATSTNVVFFLTAQNRGAELALKLDHLVKKRNEKCDKDKPQSSPARIRRFFGMKRKKSKKDGGLCNEEVTSVILVDTDYQADGETAGTIPFAQPGWYIYAPQAATTKSRLLRALGFEFPPSLIVVDTLSKSVVTTQGRRYLAEDIDGNNFPWWPPHSNDLLKGTLVKRGGEKLEYSSLTETARGFLFGAQWCPPARLWIKQLIPVYESLRSNGKSIELVFCSSDRTQDAFDQFLEQMPWPAFSYDTAKTLALTRLWNVSGIPALLLVDDKGTILSRHGRSSLLSDPLGQLFPWGFQSMYELNELTMCRLRDEPSLILFTEGSPEDMQFSLSILDSVARRLYEERLQIEEKRAEEREKRKEDRENSENGNSLSKSSSSDECSSIDSSEMTIPPQADPLQILYTAEDPICDHILEKILGLGDAPLPLLCIVDGLAGQFCICDEPDVSEQVVGQFVEEYRRGKLKWIPLPGAREQTSKNGTSTILQHTLVSESPSQNSLSDETKTESN